MPIYFQFLIDFQQKYTNIEKKENRIRYPDVLKSLGIEIVTNYFIFYLIIYNNL